MQHAPSVSLAPGQGCAISGVEVTVLDIGQGPRVGLRLGPAGRCERRVALRVGERITAGGVTLSLGPGTTAERAEILLG